jgi:hypothetical protein
VAGSYPVNDTACGHPLLDYLDYTRPDTNAVEEDTAAAYRHRRMLTALYAYWRFGLKADDVPCRYRLSHEHFLAIMGAREKPREAPWILRQALRLLQVIDKYILSPLVDALAGPFKRLAALWKALVIVGAAIFVLALLFLIAKGVERAYSPGDVRIERAAGGGAVSQGPRDRLAQARRCIDAGRYADAAEMLYKWLIAANSGPRGVRRREWWTNRQFLDIMRMRHPGRLESARRIVMEYERTAYGHKPADEVLVKSLADEAAADELRN